MQGRGAWILAVMAVLMMACLWQQTTAAPSWRPQGRFGKRGDSASFPVSAKVPVLAGELELPVEELSAGRGVSTLRLLTKLCSLTGAAGFSPCSVSSENASETY